MGPLCNVFLLYSRRLWIWAAVWFLYAPHSGFKSKNGRCVQYSYCVLWPLQKSEGKSLQHIIGFHSSSTPGVFYRYLYNHAHRPRLEKLLYIELFRSSEVPAGILNHFWIQVVVSELKRPLRNRFGSETVKNSQLKTAICNGHSPTDKRVHSGATVM